MIFIFIIVQSINIKNIIICGTKIIIFIIIESINTKKILLFVAPMHKQGNPSARSRHVARGSGCAP
jgi:hypothetical protein